MLLKKKNVSITKKFRTAFLLVAIIPLILFGIISYIQQQHAVTNNIMNMLLISSQHKKIALEQWLEGVHRQTKIIAHQNALVEPCLSLCNTEAKGESITEAQARVQEIIKENLSDQNYLNGAYIAAASGEIVFSLSAQKENLAKNVGDLDFFKIGKTQMFISDLRTSPFSGAEALLVSHPIQDPKGNLLGVIMFEVGTQPISEIMAERTGLGETGDTYLVNYHNEIIAQGKKTQGAKFERQSTTKGIEEAKMGKTVVDGYEDINGGNLLAAYVWFPKQQWIIVSEMHMSEVALSGWRLLYENAVLILLIVLSIYIFSRYFAKKFSMPVLELKNMAEVVASGDLRERAVTRTNDEIGKLSEAFNQMVGSLATMNQKVHEMSISIASAANEILSSSEEQEIISMQQSSAVSETSATIEELSVSAKQVAQNAQSITQQVEGTARKIMFLSEKAMEINKITTVIEDIAQQIHLLSLNASIEAARAGEHGKGFEVVASEIRKLSEKANKQTSDISSIVEDIQNATSGAVLSTEQAVNGVRAITLSIQQQESATNQISVAMNEINLGMKQSIEGTKQTVHAVESLNGITRAMSDTIKEFKY